MRFITPFFAGGYMQKNLAVFLISLLFAMVSNATSHDTLELSGKWNLVVTVVENGDPYESQLTFVKSDFKSHSGAPLYFVDGSLGDLKVWAASVEVIGSQQHLAWWLLRGEEFDAESNMILSITPNELSLGGDFEEYEVAKLIKVTDQ